MEERPAVQRPARLDPHRRQGRARCVCQGGQGFQACCRLTPSAASRFRPASARHHDCSGRAGCRCGAGALRRCPGVVVLLPHPGPAGAQAPAGRAGDAGTGGGGWHAPTRAAEDKADVDGGKRGVLLQSVRYPCLWLWRCGGVAVWRCGGVRRCTSGSRLSPVVALFAATLVSRTLQSGCRMP